MENLEPLVPGDLATLLGRARKEVEGGGLQPVTLAGIIGLLDSLPPDHAARAEARIAYAAGLFGTPVQSLGSRLLFGPRPLVPSLGGAEHLFVFHRNGHAREEALKRFEGGLRSPFFVVAVACRLNDWVPQVREAAQRCVARTFPLTEPSMIAEAAIPLLRRRHSWRRWNVEAYVLDREMARPDVATCLIERIAISQSGAMASTLRNLLRTPGYDHLLEKVATEAVQPAVRATALRALIHGRASWPAGYRRQWIDKPNGVYRRLTEYDERTLSVQLTRERFVASAALDRSASVRRVAAAALVEFGDSLANAGATIEALALDPSPAIRERIGFVAKNLAEWREARTP